MGSKEPRETRLRVVCRTAYSSWQGENGREGNRSASASESIRGGKRLLDKPRRPGDEGKRRAGGGWGWDAGAKENGDDRGVMVKGRKKKRKKKKKGREACMGDLLGKGTLRQEGTAQGR